jgi:hypothetical protein
VFKQLGDHFCDDKIQYSRVNEIYQSCQKWPAILGQILQGLTQDWHFAIENEWGLTIFSTRTTKPICNFENPGTVQTTESANISRYVILNFRGPFGRDGSWTYNNQCNQCLSPLTLWVQILSDEVYLIQHYVIKFVSDLGRSVVFSRYSDFLHQYNWPPRYNWNIVESGIKHHNP